MQPPNINRKNYVLRSERLQRHWSQRELAERVGATVATVKRWERQATAPGPYFRLKLTALFGKSEEELGLREVDALPATPPQTEASGEVQTSSFPTHISTLWAVPYLRNPYFTGRDPILERLHTVLTHQSTCAALTQSYAVHGLGGIGKTQLAIEYAYQHRSDYDAVLWVEAETQTTLVSSFITLAALLMLPEKAEGDQTKIVAEVLRWLNGHERWLLIFDNVEDLSLLKPFLPASDRGALLLTTRLQSLGTLAQRVELPPMTMQEGCDFLLARANRLRQDEEDASIDPQEMSVAQQIVSEMGGLPLALEQAGAYIDATRCDLSDYVYLFRTAQHHLLDKHEPSSDHPLSVSRTFALAFEQVEQRNPLAAELLTICAFLAPDAIPEMFFLEGASLLGPTFEARVADPLAFSEAIKVLLSYSLIRRHIITHTITVHRLVQAVLKNTLPEALQRTWARRVLCAMSQIFPAEKTQTNYWQTCEWLLPHARLCTTLSNQWGEESIAEGIILMAHIAVYLSHRARYAEAESLFQHALSTGEQVLGSEHPLIAEVLHGLANIYRKQGKNVEAERLYQQALHLREHILGAKHPQVAESLHGLATIYTMQGKYEQAEPLFWQAVAIREQAFGQEHPLITYPLNSLGILYCEQGKYEQAEPLYQRALRINEQNWGPEHPEVAYPLNNLGILYYEQGKYTEAEPLYQRALRINEQNWGPEHPEVTYPLSSLAKLYYEQGKYAEAESLFQRALHICEQSLGPEHSQMAESLHGLAEIYREQGKHAEAEPLFQHALSIRKQALEPYHPDLAETLHGFAALREAQNKSTEATSLYCRALAIREKVYGQQHPKTINTRERLRIVSVALSRTEETRAR